MLEFLIGAALATQSASVPDRLSGMDCTPFRWVAVGDHSKGAIVVDLTIDGRRRTMQLDTGADISFLNNAPAQGVTSRSVKVGKTELGPLWFAQTGGKDDGGTLGLDALIGQVLAIDFPGSRLCFARPADFPYSIYSATNWTPAAIRNGKFFITLSVNGQARTDFFFDTGASLFPLSTDDSTWRQLTGLNDIKSASQTIEGSAWGKKIALMGAPVLGDLEVGGLKLPRAMVYVRSDKADFFASAKQDMAGLVGNAAVWDHVVLLYLSSRPAFGLLKASKAN